MITKKDLIIVVLAAFCLTATLFMIVPTTSSPDAREYDPWLDYNDDGKIDIKDVANIAKRYGALGEPFAAKAGLEYDSGWVTLDAATTGPGIIPPIYPSENVFVHDLGTTELFVYVLAKIDGKIAPFPDWSFGDFESWYLISGNEIMVKNYLTQELDARIIIWKISHPTTTTTITCDTDDFYFYAKDSSYTVAHDRDSADNIVNDPTVITVGQYNWTILPEYGIYRAGLYFNTSSIPDDAVITNARLCLYGEGDLSEFDFNITICSGMPTYPHKPAVASDFNYIYYTSDGGYYDSTEWKIKDWNNITLSIQGIDWINLEGWTNFLLRSNNDINAKPASGDPEGISYERVSFFATEIEAYPDPTLEVTYYIP